VNEKEDKPVCAEEDLDVSGLRNKGHGRHSAESYTTAEVIKVSHDVLYPGAACLQIDCRGRVYLWDKPSNVIRLLGQSMVRVIRYEREVYRCNLCLTLFTATLPESCGQDKYTDSLKAVLAVNHYVFGLPFYRIAKYHQSQGVPLPRSNQFTCMEQVFNAVIPVYRALQKAAANGELIQFDDTTARIQSLIKENQQGSETGRRGIFTTVMLSRVGQQKVILTFTGRSHAGENMTALLSHRDVSLDKVILMSDALSRNRIKTPEIAKRTKVSYCLVHARRYFFECREAYPNVCEPVLKWIGQVYAHEAHCKTSGYTPEQRLRYHRRYSKPVMGQIIRFLKTCVKKRYAEPNSSGGRAIKYMQNHYRELTLFLSVAGAILDNNESEQIIKVAPVMYRKNSQQYHTPYGALIGDVLMSLLFTAQHAGVDPVDYLQCLLPYRKELQGCAEDWLPWHYKATLQRESVAKVA
jgi:transposase